jgi:hypothetical protein
MSNEFEGQKMADWNKGRPPFFDPVWDPIPWWIIPSDKLEQIIVVQIDSKIQTMQNELNKMKQIREIVASECK